ncbi:unnamed protein product [Didymodactylos carnosus]|uniref:Uncharacterized protein n=1 Tax=Didymodactylos carnosus TaxID=1234261 RepID=A0A815FW60_9BILA|nr:unnamed protein product [Didymodactylos carnosus]CAF1330504.1 unnamed protein product [Didymodactylos carnosus]CAF3590259.1 unnamed protein product [Didymodactylos carnosus]CAF4183692.1 unnamed protein product [Didymodactylos carnosus]
MHDYDRASRYCKLILDDLPANHDLTCRCYSIIGECYLRKENYDLAQENYEVALKHCDLASTAVTYNNLGLVYKRKKSWTLSYQYYEKSLEIYSITHKPDDPLIATTLNNLSYLLLHTEMYDKALLNLSKVLDIRLKHLPLAHPLVGATYFLLGDAYLWNGDYKTAMYNYDKPQPSILISLTQLAKDNYEIAIKCYNKSIELKLLSDTGDLKNVSSCYNNMGVTYSRLGVYEMALSCFDKADEIYKKMIPIKHLNIAACRLNMGRAYAIKFDNDSARHNYYQALYTFETCSETDTNRLLAITYFYVAELDELENDYANALKNYYLAKELGFKSLPSTHSSLLRYISGVERMIQRSLKETNQLEKSTT